MLLLESCSAGYGGRRVVEDFTLSVAERETEAIIGPSGCGKSTLLTVAAGLKAPEQGRVLLDGAAVVEGDRRVGLILQQYGLFPWFTVEQNVELGLRIRGVPVRERAAAAAAELARVGLGSLGGRHPGEISGGQQQRAAIARSLVLSPQLLLMDEPFSALDALTRESLQELLLAVLGERRMAAVIVTHSIEEAVYLGRHVTLMAGEPGKAVSRFDNPGQGAPGYRSDPAFFRLCGEVRACMESHREGARG
jgi:NitT/TauT family transport system ATP-binding protein